MEKESQKLFNKTKFENRKNKFIMHCMYSSSWNKSPHEISMASSFLQTQLNRINKMNEQFRDMYDQNQ